MTGSIPPPNPLTYEGQVVVPFIQRPFPPQTTFNKFPVPTIWIDPMHENAYILVSKALGVADWILLGGSPGALDTITTPDSIVVVPSAGNINFLNGTGMSITGASNNITFNVSGGVAILYTADSGTASPSGGNLIINGGTTGLTTTASGNTVSLVGTLNAGHGGTGSTTLTAHSVLIGEGTSAVGFAGPNASTHAIFMAAGAAADPVFTTTGTPYVTGISFDAGSNVMSAYSQGSWTPGISFGGGTSGITYFGQVGTYTIIGNLFLYNYIITLTSKGVSTGAALITGLPFTTPSNAAGFISALSFFSNLTLDAGYTFCFLQPTDSATTMAIGECGSGLPSSPLSNANFANNTLIAGQGYYYLT